MRPKGLWNKTSRPSVQLYTPTEVLDVKRGISQTGCMFLVENKSGDTHWMDAEWFHKPVPRMTGY